MTLAGFRRELKRMAVEAGSQRELARKLGISPMLICDILKGRRDPGEKTLGAMGMKREVVITRSVKITKEKK